MYAPIVKFSVEEKLFSVHQVLQSRISTNAEAKRIDVANETLKDWIRKYEAGGVERGCDRSVLSQEPGRYHASSTLTSQS
ncbi:transposase [Enterococcus sp. BWT-B8]|uniref:transposase n=1 Tax=Enterococcus sp. BWT-B8 TaxID=2885157 RepID=UPI001E4E751A|nr:transposase [Enterococcus sp. BWT-B8]MCB5951084.1 transposase [Enterococcus sp. BWT-B8]